jgi:glycosyltransferase involved in cell wall biosynthesis
MKNSKPEANSGGLFILGTLYPVKTGGMEIFNYYFLNHQLSIGKEPIYYLGEYKTSQAGGTFVLQKRRWPTRFFYPFQFYFNVLKLRNRLKYAYISYAEQSWIISFSQCIILNIFNIPYIVTIHWGKEPYWKFRFPNVYFFRHAHSVIGVSEPICIYFKKAIPELDFIYIPPLIPFQQAAKEKSALKEQFGYHNQEKILLYAGSLKPMKNPDKIVEAFRTIGTAFLESNNIRLLFVGSGAMAKELKDQVDIYELGGYIRFVGLISRENMPDYYKAADFYVISSDYEGTSLSLLEAMFNRLAIVASDAPGINGMLRHGENALLYETTNIEQLAETFKSLFTDPLLADRLSENAFTDFNLHYSYESMVKKYESVFSSV